MKNAIEELNSDKGRSAEVGVGSVFWSNLKRKVVLSSLVAAFMFFGADEDDVGIVFQLM